MVYRYRLEADTHYPRSSLVCRAKNVLTMKARMQTDTDLEAIYLLGDFGVYQSSGGDLVLGGLARHHIGHWRFGRARPAILQRRS